MRRAGLLLAGLLAAAGAARADELYFYVEDGRIVFTNVPSRADARLVPGFAARVEAARAHLPPSPWDREIAILARRYGVPADLIKAVAWVESAYDPRAVSPKGAMGLMQLMPETARHYGVEDPFDPYESLRAGTALLRDLLETFDHDTRLALAAYNAGPAAVRRHRGVPAYPETRAYVERVEAQLGKRRRPARAPRTRGSLRVEMGPDGTVHISN